MVVLAPRPPRSHADVRLSGGRLPQLRHQRRPLKRQSFGHGGAGALSLVCTAPRSRTSASPPPATPSPRLLVEAGSLYRLAFGDRHVPPIANLSEDHQGTVYCFPVQAHRHLPEHLRSPRRPVPLPDPLGVLPTLDIPEDVADALRALLPYASLEDRVLGACSAGVPYALRIQFLKDAVAVHGLATIGASSPSPSSAPRSGTILDMYDMGRCIALASVRRKRLQLERDLECLPSFSNQELWHQWMTNSGFMLGCMKHLSVAG